MRITLVLFMLVFIQLMMAFTNVPGGDVSGTYSLGGSPYMINGDITIPNGQTLTINHGVQIIFSGAFRLKVDGRLLAVGTPADSIVFTTANSSTTWKGIRFYETAATNDSSFIDYCILEKGSVPTGSYVDGHGGALCVALFSKLHLEHSRFSNNYAATGGGACYFDQCDMVIKNCIFSYNNTPNGRGGGLAIGAAISPYTALNRIKIYNSQFNQNNARDGGGVYLATSTGSLVSTCEFDNDSSYVGGGVMFSYCTDCIVSSCTITRCISNSLGGGINGTNSSATFTNNSISRCFYTWDMDNPRGMGISVTDGGPYIISNNVIFNNLAEPTFTATGGGVRIGNCSYQLVGNVIFNNTASSSGGVYANSGTPGNIIWNNTITNNSALSTGGIWVDGYADIRNNIIWGNSTSYGQVRVSSDGTNHTWAYNDIQDGIGTFYIPNSPNWDPATQYVNNLDAYPQFISPSAGAGTSHAGEGSSWQISGSSVCRNAGDPEMNTGQFVYDCLGNERISEGRIDLGAYEFPNPIPRPNPVLISHSGNIIIISWDPVTTADGYAVYSSSNPLSGFALLDNNPTHFILINSQIEWTAEANNSVRFYRVVTVQN